MVLQGVKWGKGTLYTLQGSLVTGAAAAVSAGVQEADLTRL